MERPDWLRESRSYSLSANDSVSVTTGGKRKNWKVKKTFFGDDDEDEDEDVGSVEYPLG